MTHRISRARSEPPTLYSLTVSDYSYGKWRCCLSIIKGDKKQEFTFGIRDIETLCRLFSAVTKGRVRPDDFADAADELLAREYGEFS